MATAGAPPDADAAAPPARPANVPPTFVWTGSSWTAPPGAPPVTGGYATFDASGNTFIPDGKGGLRPAAPAAKAGGPLDTAYGATKGVVTHPIDSAHSLTNSIGLTNPPPPDISKSPDAEALRKFSGQLVDEYNNRAGADKTVNHTQSDQARAEQQSAIDALNGVASGKTATAADSLLQKGADQAARTAMGTAATYSAANPGEALRLGLAAGTDAGNRAASDAGILKGQEQAAARQSLVDAATSMRSGDTASSGQDIQQTALNDARAAAARHDALTAATLPYQTSKDALANKMNNDAANSTVYGSILSDLAKSDGRLKTDIRDGGADADAFLSSLSPRSYEWKNPDEPTAAGPGPQLGVIAQEMRPRDTRTAPDGTKWISSDVVGKLLAGMGRLHERVAAVEGGGEPEPKWGPNPYPKDAPPEKPIVMPRRRP